MHIGWLLVAVVVVFVVVSFRRQRRRRRRRQHITLCYAGKQQDNIFCRIYRNKIIKEGTQKRKREMNE